MKYKYDISAEKEFKKVAIFKGKPKGILIFDSYNNDWFPLKLVEIDKNNFSLSIVKDEFHREFGGNSLEEIFMPWHYSIELMSKNYYAINTRPITYQSLIPGYEDYITICVIGNSNIDLYTPDIYRVIAHTVINPLHYIPGWHLVPDSVVQYHKLGSGFKTHQLIKNFR